MLSLVMTDLCWKRESPGYSVKRNICVIYHENFKEQERVPTSLLRRDAVEQLHPVKRGQPFLQRHGELVREATPVLVSHLVLESVKDLKSKHRLEFIQRCAAQL